ncbi:hypothetical protein GK1397 [Geobacillus kaustophilus HTA426]|uniref:Uncharacterized protein n=1 Tax=Geobacillus kaustophilus (strain HTA426) TaxID=235909 RepID=Q5L054_GEOKA|nr:hypothetical protein GK1397 [Geobacillus kaustophilus HTA426]
MKGGCFSISFAAWCRNERGLALWFSDARRGAIKYTGKQRREWNSNGSSRLVETILRCGRCYLPWRSS